MKQRRAHRQGAARSKRGKRAGRAASVNGRRAKRSLSALSPLAAGFDALPASIAVLDRRGVIVFVNAPWRQFAAENGLTALAGGVGANYLAVCDRAAGAGAEEAQRAAGGIRAVIAGERDEFTLEYSCPTPRAIRWFGLRVSRFRERGALRVLVAHYEVTELKQIEVALRESEAGLRLLVEHIPALVTTTDTSLLVLSAVGARRCRRCRDQHARDAKSALRRLFLDESALQRVQVGGGADPLERGDAAAGECRHRLAARIDRLAVDHDLARAALLEAAAELGGSQPEIVAQDQEQRRVGLDLDLPHASVDLQSDRFRHGPMPLTKKRGCRTCRGGRIRACDA
jgi:PAS domain-containing protein